MKKLLILLLILWSFPGIAQMDSAKVYKKRVLESTEIDFLTSYYWQDGDNASVTGGIGTEELTDFTSTIIVSVPLNDDDVLTIDAGISAYSSASSSNVNPFSGGGDDDGGNNGALTAVSPWYESSGASGGDLWINFVASYTHNSDDRNKIWSANASFATEYDYTSFGFGGSYTRLFNEKNTEIGIKGNVYLDTWGPQYPIELRRYDGDLNSGYFGDTDILDQDGNAIDKNGTEVWNPANYQPIVDEKRNTFSLSLSFSQILTRNLQISLFSDIILQDGWLANPMQRVYFSDVNNYYIGNPQSIPVYESPENTDVFQLSDDIERLPTSRLKIPIGARLNYFINEFLVLRTYYRYYSDDWGIKSHTANLELPVKISNRFTITPSYRYYTQTEADYFAPYNQHLSSSEFYTSDYDLSEFDANQYGLAIRYTDIFTKFHIRKFGLKSVDLKYSLYQRSTGLDAGIITAGFKFVMD